MAKKAHIPVKPERKAPPTRPAPPAHQAPPPHNPEHHRPVHHTPALPVHKPAPHVVNDGIDPNSKDPWDIFYYQHNRRLNY